ncbi:hypothetical protein [Synechococcus sp. PCC 6312]|uniref:hypothetical protein n=1 Tax=Synechococcus sp. (strain ATCC 27167 / PCC 6312) TaxID=195253 RepID=UPI00029F3F54|nr:hypothetical protein [Synechococcus sp. PCC 6312]AFY62001.1 hypothetical protein Syn6312_2942 [Synechococcus sp. PCC 6312]
METQELKALIKESLREGRLFQCQSLMPSITDEAQGEIISELGVPTDYENQELIDMTEWVKNSYQVPQIINQITGES